MSTYLGNCETSLQGESVNTLCLQCQELVLLCQVFVETKLSESANDGKNVGAHFKLQHLRRLDIDVGTYSMKS